MDALPAPVPDRMHVLQLHLFCMSSWAPANFALANLGIGNSLAWISGQAEEHSDTEHEGPASRAEAQAQRGQIKLPTRLGS